MAVYTVSFFIALGYLWYCFVVYKKGLESRYSSQTLMDLAILSGVLGWIGARAGFVAGNFEQFRENLVRVILLADYPGYNYLGLLLGLILAVIILTRREEIKLYEGLDLTGLGLPGAIAFERLGMVFGGDVHLVWKVPAELLSALVFLVIFVWLWRLEKEYRTIAWYRFRRTQARAGFIFGAFLFLSGLLVISANIWPVFLIQEFFFGAVCLVTGVGLVYWRSGRSLVHDVKLLGLTDKWYTKRK